MCEIREVSIDRIQPRRTHPDPEDPTTTVSVMVDVFELCFRLICEETLFGFSSRIGV